MSELPSGVKVQCTSHHIHTSVFKYFQGELNFTLVSSLEEVLLHAFEGGLKPSSKL